MEQSEHQLQRQQPYHIQQASQAQYRDGARDDEPHEPHLPASSEPSEPSTAPEPWTQGSQSRQRPPAEANDVVILVAENEENNRRLIEHILHIAGYRFVSATNGMEVLEILDRQQVNVVLLDLSMPLLDGYKTTERIRQRPDGATLPIVAVTAYAMSDDRERALRSGCTDYLAKPFRPNELLEVVQRMLSLQQ